MLTDTLLEEPRWRAIDLPAVAERSARASLRHLGIDPARHEIAVLACDDARIATLNADFRAKSQPTNVLSWPAEDLSAETPGGAPLPPEMEELGDIAIAFDTCTREAETAQKAFVDHVTHLIVHGTLHLLGYDHVDDADAQRMEALEIAILAELGLANPYL